MVWYRTGRVAVTNNSATVTGAGTDFVSNARVGDAFIGPNGALYEVTNIASATVLSISPVYGGATASNATYGIVPVQGYVKMLVDKAGSILTDWGATLAGLGPVANQSIVPLSMGGTGAATVADARTALGLKTAAVADLVGTSTAGAVFEYGTNANGSYTKYADGTMICSAKIVITVALTFAQDGLFVNQTPTQTFPAAFIEAPAVSFSMRAATVISQPYGITTTTYSGFMMGMTSRSVTQESIMLARGRWK